MRQSERTARTIGLFWLWRRAAELGFWCSFHEPKCLCALCKHVRRVFRGETTRRVMKGGGG